MSATDDLVLSSDTLTATIRTDRGGDIVSLVDNASGVDVMFKTPWGRRERSESIYRTDSVQAWLETYAGGWQLLAPNASFPRTVAGTELGYHGEAAMLPWRVVSASDTSAELSVQLFTAPLAIRRRITVDGAVLRVESTIRNESPVPVDLLWVEHPGFGAPFIDGGCRVDTGARRLIGNEPAAGTILAPDSIHQLPEAVAADGSPYDFSTVPGPEDVREVFAVLTDFDEPFFAVTNPALGFGIGLRWDAGVLPHAWVWQEVHSSPGFPWFRRAYSFAIEPANCFPGDGKVAEFERSVGHTLEPDSELSASVELVRFAAAGPVTAIRPGGEVVHSGQSE